MLRGNPDEIGERKLLHLHIDRSVSVLRTIHLFQMVMAQTPTAHLYS